MDKVVLITGASRGIGRSCATEFAEKGYSVVINYFNSEDRALELKLELESKYNIRCMAVKADVANFDEVNDMILKVIDEFGKIDVLVNNAGIAMDCLFDDKNTDDFRRVLDVNLIGVFNTCKCVSKYMLDNKMGSIINVSSTNGIDTNYTFSMDYDASKAGVISLTKNMAIQLAPYIRVNCVAPGWVDTEMNKDMDMDFKKNEESKILLGRFADSSEIAKVIYFLASDDASYINGEVIRVDGGNR